MPVPIFTSSWRSRLSDSQFVRAGISRSSPRGPKGFRVYRKLVPGPWFASIPDSHAWSARYSSEILAPLDPEQVVAELRAMSDGVKPITLLCWEPTESGPAEWCHRALISVWLHERLGLEIYELGAEHCGCGRQHPKLADELRGG